jgi:hypothetical protein
MSKLLSMRTGHGYTEFGVSSFGTDAAIGDPDTPLASGISTCRPAASQILGRQRGGSTEHHRRACTGLARSVTRNLQAEKLMPT